jgi:hypothetical protein
MDLEKAACPVTELISRRVSTRSFDGKILSPEAYKAIEAMLARETTQPRPFGTKLRLRLIGPQTGKPARLGTYGLISGAAGFIAGAVEPGPGAMEDMGYALEGAVLALTGMGLDSCWIGGVFDRQKTLLALDARNGEVVPAVAAFGRAAGSRSLADRIVTGMARSRSRKALKEILIGDSSGGASDAMITCLEAVRLAPSASNKQPWRIWIEPGNLKAVEFYLDEDKLYNNSLGPVHIQNIDLGIAMRHFEEAARELGFSGTWSGLGNGTSSGHHRGTGLIPIARWDFG